MEGKRLRCPHCGSADVDYIDDHEISYIESGFGILEYECTECERAFSVKVVVDEIRTTTYDYEKGEWIEG